MGGFSFIGHRLVQLVPVLLGITFLCFFLIHLVPGDPVSAMLGVHYTPVTAEKLRHALGLDQSLWQQYLIFMGNLLHGNLGDSVYYQQPVLGLIMERVEPTIWLVGYAALLAAVISIPLGIVTALLRDSVVDQAIRTLFVVALAMPAFWTGIVLILIFSIHWQIFPISGFGDTFVAHVYDLFLPALTIALPISAVLIRSLRNSILTVMRADYIRTARANGFSRTRVVVRHVLRNALISTVTIFGLNIAFLVGATVIIENVFAVGGVGQLLVSSIQQRDYTVVQGITLLIALFVVAINLLTDVMYVLLDPRISFE